MNAITEPASGRSNGVVRRARLARVTGLLYLVLAVCGMFAPLVLERLVVSGDPGATASNIVDSRWLFGGSLATWLVIIVADVAIAVTFLLLLEPVSRALSLLAAALRLVYAAVLAAVVLNLYDAFLLLTSAERGAGLDELQREQMAMASLNTFNTGFLLALVIFGAHLLALGILLYRSRYVPLAFGVLLVIAGGGYIADSLATLLMNGHSGLTSAVLLMPAVAGELGLTAWLLVKGVKVRPAAAATTLSARPEAAGTLGAGVRGGAR